MVKIRDFWVEKDILTMHWACDHLECKGACCTNGCGFPYVEKNRIGEHIKEIAEYLRDRPELPFWKDVPDQWEFCEQGPEGMDDYLTKTFADKCIFLMQDGRCAIHAFCVDREISWENLKFNVCVVWPLRFNVINAEWHIERYRDLDDPIWDRCSCIRRAFSSPETRAPHVIDSIKTVIISRICENRYLELHDYVKKHYNAHLPSKS